MPRRIADSGPALLSGEHSNVLADIRGRVRLTSRNLMPNGDLDDSDERGGLDGWNLEAPPKVSGWMPYYADASGAPLHRLLFEALGIGRGYFKVDRTPIKAGQAPDPTDRGRVPRPERFGVDLVPIGDIGFAADNYWVAINYIVGNPRLPRRRLRWTEESDYVQINVPTDGMGIEVFLPPDRPEGVTAVGVFVKRGALANPARLNEVVGVRYGVRESVKLREWNNGYAPPGVNTTYIGALNQIRAPRVGHGSRSPGDRRIRAHGRSGGGEYQFRVLVKTEFGWTLAGKDSRWYSNGFGKRSSAFWVTANGIKNVAAEEFAVEVRGRLLDRLDVVSEWARYGFSSGQMSFPMGTWVPVMGWNEDGLPTTHRLESANSQSEDESGVAKPEVDLETPLTFAGSPIGPGTKFLKATWAYKEEDDLGRIEERESPPSPLVRVNVPSSGGAATHTIRFQRPPGMNEERNPRFVNLKRDQKEEDWIRDPEGATGAIFGPQLGYTEVTDTTAKNTNQAVYYSAPVNITNGKDRAIRMTVELSDYVAGRVRVDVEFLDSSGAVIPGATRTIGRAFASGREYIHVTVGSRVPASHADVRWPQQATHYRRKFVHVGSSTSGVRNFVATYKDIGAYPGLAHPEKRFDLSEDERLVAQDYPPNAYISVLSRELVDEERIRPEQNTSGWVREVIDFDDGVPADLSFITDGSGIQSLFTERPISGAQSLRLTQGSGTTAYMRYDAGSGKTTLDAISKVRIETLASSGRTGLFRVHGAAGGSAFVGRFEVATNGDLWCQSRNAAGAITSTTLTDFGADDVHELRLEIGIEGAGTANGALNFYVTRGGTRRNRLARHTGVDLTGVEPRYADAGVVSAAAGGGAVVEVDEIEVYEADAWEDVPGRLVEYWAALGTPASPLNGMRGMKAPVEGGKTEILSTFLDARGIPNNAALLRFVAKNDQGHVVGRYGPLATITGRKRMRRYWRRITWPADATYIEFVDNTLGAGLLRYGPIQLEADTPDGRPTPFTNKHVPDGMVEVEFDMLIPDVPKGHILGFRNKLKEYRGADERSDTPDLTSVTLEFCSSRDRLVYSPWTADLEAVPLAPYGTFKVRANLHTDDLETTPELYELVLDFIREKPVVCRSDGTEFSGGAMPIDFPTVQYPPNIREETYADNSTGFATFGERQARADGWKIEAYFDDGVEQISREIGKGDSALVVDVLGKRYHCQTFAAPFGPPNRQREYKVENRELGGFVFVSETIKSLVLAEEPL